ncbi:SDR family NAD(P)-dependent oxidoreductase [uncultured Microbacterium sp.]|uniref:SDR family NAD(P)-dependent oxidoreductase n=1 Tax=uncultured Microbacterium sp. TaxID=191216 RepID=UPI0025E2C7B5|nr:SDR family NAD(P)-dependent oxidoreductase [uncultured Microbacterium sp.]
MTGSGRVALVTGAAGGVGSGVCRALLDRGWTVIAHVRSAEQGRSLADGGARTVAANLESRRELSDLIAQVWSETDRIDVLVNNAALGYGPPDAVRKVTEDGIESRLAVNVLAPLFLMKGLVKMIGHGGRVVNLASTNQQLVDANDLQLCNAWSRENAYRQSKALSLIVTEVFSRRWASRSVAVNAIHPGTRLPTKMVLESGAEPLGSLALGIETCVKEVTSELHNSGVLVNAGEQPARIAELYPDETTNEALVARLEEFAP